MKLIKLQTAISPDMAPNFLEFCRVRYAREAEQWRANHGQRKQERDAARTRCGMLEAKVALLENEIKRRDEQFDKIHNVLQGKL